MTYPGPTDPSASGAPGQPPPRYAPPPGFPPQRPTGPPNPPPNPAGQQPNPAGQPPYPAGQSNQPPYPQPNQAPGQWAQPASPNYPAAYPPPGTYAGSGAPPPTPGAGKPSRQRRNLLVLLLLLVLLIGGGVAALVLHNGKSTKSPTTAHSTGPLPNAPTRSDFASNGPDTTGLPIKSGNWRLDSVTVTSDAENNFTADAQITYTGSGSPSGPAGFDLTLSVGGKPVDELAGSTSAGGQSTVQFLSVTPTKRVPGPYTYKFKVSN